MKYRNHIFCLLFLAILFLPLLCFGNQDSRSVLHEKRNLSAAVGMPHSLSDVNAELTSDLETYFNDHIGFRQDLVALANTVRIRILGANAVNTRVIEGKDGWLFYNPQGPGGDPIAEYTGIKTYTQEDLENLTAYLLQIQDVCREAGSEFYLIICPNKTTIYGERYLPDYYVKAEGPGRADLLVDYVRSNTDIPCVYNKEELLRYSEDEYVYFKHDTHWTELGAYVSYRDWYHLYTGQWLPPLEECAKIPIEGATDLSDQLGVTLEEETYYRVDLQRDISFEERDSDIFGYRYHSTNANGKTAMMFRDSFLIYMQPYICQDFEDSYIIPRQIGDEDLALIAERRPDVVIFEMLERALP